VGGVITGTSTSVSGTTTAASVVGGVITGSSTSVTGITTAASVVGGVITGSSTSVTGNITGGNVLTGGLIYTTGQVQGGLIYTTGNISGGNVNVTANVVAGNIISTVVVQGLTVQATGNLTGGNANIINAVNAVNGNFTNVAATITTAAQPYITSLGTLGSLSVTGNVTGGNLSVGTGIVSIGNLVNNNSNGVGNIGSSSLYFNTVFAVATSAQYADLAENYLSDAPYVSGTVVSIGGDAEVTQSSVDADSTVIGVVSTNPAYNMNTGLVGEYVVAVALTGRVPCRVTGSVKRGSALVSNGDGTARSEESPQAGTIIGKALTSFEGSTGVIEVVIGRF
jgi:hypothetical protein